jgi:uncharacterized membrane protein YvlD (DUF360 family)
MSSPNLITIALIVGFIGDAILQALVNLKMGGPSGWGLKGYFRQHGSIEALFIAAGMMGIFYAIYEALGLPLEIWALAIYGVVMDFIFRKGMIFPSLGGYYRSLNYFWSAVWGAIPMILPLLIYRALEK